MQRSWSDNEAWLDAFHAAMRPFTSDESFQNFVDGAEDRLSPRLITGPISSAWSRSSGATTPAISFRFPQSIPLTL